ncbi:MAG: PHP domain-containing protein [Anaerolineales bacterium]
MGLADLHLHTIYSYDGTASVPAVLTRARQIGLDVIAITDHDEIAGAIKALRTRAQLWRGSDPRQRNHHRRGRPARLEYH